MAIVLILTLLDMLIPQLSAKDYGVHGHLYPIEEENLIDYLSNRVESLSVQDIRKANQNLQEHYKESFVRPSPVKDLKPATLYSIHYFDPTVVSKQEVKDSSGNVILKKGDSYNPLEHVSLSEELLFFDGDDADQLQWAKSLNKNSKWILTSGCPVELEEKENRAIYFDQNGLLTRKLKISAIPARVSQEKLHLKIETIPLERGICDQS